MPDYDLSQVECLLYDPEVNVRRLLRDALAQLRLTRVQMFGQVEALRQALAQGSPDLLILDGAGEDGEVPRLVSQLRHGAFGGNPFAGVIVTAFNPTHQLLARVTNSGADALLAKPIAPRQIRDRIFGLAEASRSFVVTADYVGPDRRRGPREQGSTAPSVPLLVEVPNTIRLKATGAADKVSLPALVEAAQAEVNERKLVRLAFQLAFLAEYARAGLGLDPADRLALDHVARIPGIAEDLLRRLPAGAEGGSVPAAVPARAVAVEAARIAAPGAPEAEATAGVGRLAGRALDLMAEISPEREREAMAREVADAAAAYRARLESILQAKAAEAAAQSGSHQPGSPPQAAEPQAAET
jgi:CheY-like chemotaxis protein